jgi:small subunit ribosomal protein S20
MANLKSSKKDIRRTLRRTEANKPFRRNAKLLTKKVRKLATTGKVEEAKTMLSTAFKALDKAARKNIIHKNNAARTKSRLSKVISKAEQVA